MASLIQQLQEEALDSSGSILSLLRKAFLVAKKLDIQEFQTWIKLELNGYNDSEIPEYRQVRGTLKQLNPYHGLQPIVAEINNQSAQEMLDLFCNHTIANPISELENWIKNSKQGFLRLQLPPKRESILYHCVNSGMEVVFFITTASIVKILEKVKTIILEWALKLEEDGIMGEGMSFTKDEKKLPLIMIIKFIFI